MPSERGPTNQVCADSFHHSAAPPITTTNTGSVYGKVEAEKTGFVGGRMNRMSAATTQTMAIQPTTGDHLPRCQGPRWNSSPRRSRRKTGIA